MACRNVWSSSLGRYVRKCTKRRKSIGGLGTLGQARTLKATLGDSMGVIKTAGIAAGGVLITDKVFDLIAGKLELEGWQKNAAMAATGIALGIVVGKVAKKPKLGATLAVGPVVFAALRMFADLLNVGPFAPASTAGLGLVSIDHYGAPRPALAAASAPSRMGMAQVGPGVPAWMLNEENLAGAIQV